MSPIPLHTSLYKVPWGEPLGWLIGGGSHPAHGDDHPRDGSGQGLRLFPLTGVLGAPPLALVPQGSSVFV